MDKRQRRTKTKMDNIKKVALDLFSAHGIDKISMDEIAAKANVSKVTIYKYFGSKDELVVEVVNLFMEEALQATEAVFKGDMDFMEKLRFALLSSVNASHSIGWDHLQIAWDQDGNIGQNKVDDLQNKVKALMTQLIDEGKGKGYIDKSLPFEVFYLHSEIFRAGLKALSIDLQSVLTDKEAVETLVDLYFFGIIKRQ